jgi:hypothetical protein
LITLLIGWIRVCTLQAGACGNGRARISLQISHRAADADDTSHRELQRRYIAGNQK